MGKQARPDVSAACAITMSWSSNGPTIKDVKAANKIISELKRTSDHYLRSSRLTSRLDFGFGVGRFAGK